MKKSQDLDIDDLITPPSKLIPNNSRSTRVNSAKRSIFNNPTPMNPQTLTHTNYFQRIPYTHKKVVYEDRETIERVPVQKIVQQYKEIRKKKIVPKERIVKDHYVVEKKISYVPQVVEETKIQYVPVAVKSHRVEYVPYQRQIVHRGDVFDELGFGEIGGVMMSQTLPRGEHPDQTTNNRRSNSISVIPTINNNNKQSQRKSHIIDYYEEQIERNRSNHPSTAPNKYGGIVRQNLTEFAKTAIAKLQDHHPSPKRSRNYKIFDLPKRSYSLSKGKPSRQ